MVADSGVSSTFGRFASVAVLTSYTLAAIPAPLGPTNAGTSEVPSAPAGLEALRTPNPIYVPFNPGGYEAATSTFEIEYPSGYAIPADARGALNYVVAVWGTLISLSAPDSRPGCVYAASRRATRTDSPIVD